ncbi:MAG: hypothetical protein WCF67_10410 [Chitinophagaceae bacterium]
MPTTILKPRQFAIKRGQQIIPGNKSKISFRGTKNKMKMRIVLEVDFKPDQFNNNGSNESINATTGDCAVYNIGTNDITSLPTITFAAGSADNISMIVGEIMTPGEKGNHGN